MVYEAKATVLAVAELCQEMFKRDCGEVIHCALANNRIDMNGNLSFHVPLAHRGPMKSGVDIAWHDNGIALGI